MFVAVREFLFPAADRDYYDGLAEEARGEAVVAFSRREAGRFRDALARITHFSRKAAEAGPLDTAYCLVVARRFLDLQQYDGFGDWLQMITRTVDRQFGTVAAFLDDPRPQVVMAAARALGKSGDPAYVGRLGGLLLSSSGLEVRLALADALADLGGDAAASWLRRRRDAARDDLPVEEVLAIVAGLGRTGTAADSGYLAGLLAGPRPEVRRAAARALAECGGMPAALFLEREITAGRLAGVMSEFIDGLSRMRAGDPVPVLLRLAAGGDGETRRLVIDALGRRDGRGAGPFLVAELERARTNGQPRTPLVRALLQLGDRSLDGMLPGLFAELDEFDGLALLSQHFTRHGMREVIKPALERLAGEQDLDKLALLIDLLGSLGAVEAVPRLEQFLGHEAPGIRVMSAAALERLTGKTYPVDGLP